MKEDKLEKFVRDNAEAFNSFEPPAMAWDSIEKQLPAAKQVPVRKIWPIAWKVAAAVLIFASAWLLNDYTDQKNSSGESSSIPAVAASPAISELSDAEAYYTSQISTKQVELATYAKLHPEIIEDLKKEFREMDKNNEMLKKDLAESNADEKVIEAIILSYRVKLEILDQMLTELRKTKDGYSRQKPVETSL
jgi:hypothetical protein